jgi:hypothetical protein
MDRQGKKLVHTNIWNNDFEFFLKLIEPYKHDLTVCCECMFGWYWLADACQASGLTFVLAHDPIQSQLLISVKDYRRLEKPPQTTVGPS